MRQKEDKIKQEVLNALRYASGERTLAWAVFYLACVLKGMFQREEDE